MSAEEVERTIRSYLDAWLGGDDFASFFTEDVLWTTMETGEQLRGRQAVSDFIVALHSEIFDANTEVRSLAFADDVAALEAVFVGRQLADFGAVPASGAVVRLPYTVFYAVTGGVITELRVYFPMMALAAQLGPGATVPAA